MKTKKSFRKKALLSSVAMLLVAAVAVGSATFAWFTHNDTSTANGIYLKTMKGSSLRVSSNEQDWAPSINYNKGSSEKPLTLYPISSPDGDKWFHTHADSDQKSDSTTAVIENRSTNAGKVYYFKDMLNVQNPTGGANKYKDITISLNDAASFPNYARIALVEVASKTAFNSPLNKAAEFKAAVCAAEGTLAYQAINDTNRGAEQFTVEITPNSNDRSLTSLVAPFDLEVGQSKYFMLYIWFEGQDPDCYGDEMNTLNGLEFTVRGTQDMGT